MKKFRNILAMLMVFVMLVAVMPMNVFAEGETTGTEQLGEKEQPVDPEKPVDGEGIPATDEDKTAAKATVNALENISKEDKAAAIKAIEEAKTKEAINEAVAEATAKDDEAKKANELKKAKEEALAELEKLTHLTEEEKEAAKKAIEDAAKKEDVTKAVNDAKAKEEAAIEKEEAEKEHNITIKDATNGKVEADKKAAKKDVEVTLTITPDKDYKLKELKVMAGETKIEVKDNKFKMPAADVEVSATFEKEEVKPEPKPETKEYTISKAYTNHGSFTVSKYKAKAGETITVTATPNYGYAVKNVYYIDDNNIKHSIKNYAYNDYYYYGYNGRYNDGYYGDYYRYYSDYENNYYYDYSSYDAYLKDRHYSFWNNGYRYWDDYDYKYYNKYYDRYYDDYYRYYDDYVDNYYRRYSSYEDYLYDKHYSHYRDYKYYDKYDYRYYNYTTTDTFEMPASNVTVYVEFTDWSYYGYYYDDYYYYRYHRDKKDKEKEEKAEEEKKPAEEKTPQVYEASATINVGSNVFTKVNKNVTTTHQMDVAAYVKNGRVMLPLRYVAEALGLQVSWVPQTKTVIIWDLTQKVKIPIKSNKMIVNGVTYTSDVKPEIKNSRTMLPIANIARALGLIDGSDIIWDPVMKQVKLTRRVISK
jgi:chemotaxis protein histidine kinase CheA